METTRVCFDLLCITGNHAQALAYHARELGIPCTVYMPTIAPLTKIDNCSQLGCHVVVHVRQ